VFVGASNVPSVVRANAEVVADCRTVSEADDTTAQLPAPRRVRCAIKFATRLIRTARGRVRHQHKLLYLIQLPGCM